MARTLTSSAQSLRAEVPARDYFTALLSSLATSLYLLVAATIAWEAFALLSNSAHSFVPALEGVLGPLCHHLADRTLFFHDTAFPVCARCTGIWAGWILAALVWFSTASWTRSGRATSEHIMLITLSGLFLVGVTLAIFETAGSFSLGNLERAGLGVPLGLFAGWLLLACRERHLPGGFNEQEE